jgi:hypothetical protein
VRNCPLDDSSVDSAACADVCIKDEARCDGTIDIYTEMDNGTAAAKINSVPSGLFPATSDRSGCQKLCFGSKFEKRKILLEIL